MSRTNLILLLVLVGVAGAWWVARDTGNDESTGPAPRLFPDFNKEAADRIVIDGGWKGTTYGFVRTGSDWVLASAGGYPVKKDEIERFIDAVFNLRRDALVGESEALQGDTWTDAARGRLVTVYKQDSPMASFRVGKNPKGAYEHFFIRKEDEKRVYRSRTMLSEGLEDRNFAAGPLAGRSSGFDWHNYTNSLFKWCDTSIWRLQDYDVTGIKLIRDDLDVELAKQTDDTWQLRPAGGEPVKADVTAVDDIKGKFNSLSFEEVVSAADYDFEKPIATVIFTLEKEVEKEAEPAKEGEGEGEGEEKEETPPAKEKVTIHRTVTVAKKVSVKKRFDEGDEKPAEEPYYAISIGGDDLVENGLDKTKFVYLVNDYKIGPLKKTLDELKAKADEEEPADDDGPPLPLDDDEAMPPDDEATPPDEAMPPDDEDATPPDDEEAPPDDEEAPGDEETPPGDEDPPGDG